MPYRSLAQAAKFHAMLKRGQIKPEVVAEWDRESKGRKLPKKVKRRRKKADWEA